MSLIEVRLRPAGPWRVGHHAGDREQVDVVYHSDALYSAVTLAMRSLGWMEEWLDATARTTGEPAVRFSSLWPFMGKSRLVAPPRSVWPPVNPGKLYLQGVKLIPLEIVKTGVLEESRWSVDAGSGCLLPMGTSSPFRISMRTAAAVDRLTGSAEPHRTACLEFAANAGWWGVFSVNDAVWEGRVKTALRLLADSGFGGERSRGWGRAGEPQFSEASHLFAQSGVNSLWWLLSLYSPDAGDQVDWAGSEFAAAVRSGWIDSPAGTAAKKHVRFIEAGSVIAAPTLRGRAVDVAPEGFPHPVYRAGFALAMPAPAEIVVRANSGAERKAAVVVAPPELIAESSELIGESSELTAEPSELIAEEITPADATPDTPDESLFPVGPEPLLQEITETAEVTEEADEPVSANTIPDVPGEPLLPPAEPEPLLEVTDTPDSEVGE